MEPQLTPCGNRLHPSREEVEGANAFSWHLAEFQPRQRNGVACAACQETVEGRQPNCDCARSAYSNTPGIDAHHSTSKLKSRSLTKLMRQRLEVAAKLPAVVSQERRLRVLAKAGSERVEDAALGAVLLQNPAASDCLTECCNVLNRLTIYWGMV